MYPLTHVLLGAFGEHFLMPANISLPAFHFSWADTGLGVPPKLRPQWGAPQLPRAASRKMKPAPSCQEPSQFKILVAQEWDTKGPRHVGQFMSTLVFNMI